MKKKLLSWMLSITLMLNMLPIWALANVDDLLGNSAVENYVISEALSNITGSDVDAVTAILTQYGLLDESGELNISQTITFNGIDMPLETVMEILADESTDLTQMATVNGATITLAELKTIVEIETELARIQDTYFSGDTFDQDDVASLNSLLSQIASEGISVYGSEEVTAASEDENDTPAASAMSVGGISSDTNVLNLTGLGEASGFVKLDTVYSLNNCITVPAGEQIRVQMGLSDVQLLSGTDKVIVYVTEGETFTSTNVTTDLTYYLYANNPQILSYTNTTDEAVSLSLAIDISKDNNPNDGVSTETNSLYAYLYFNALSNCLVYTDYIDGKYSGQYGYTVSFPIKEQRTYPFSDTVSTYDWLTSIEKSMPEYSTRFMNSGENATTDINECEWKLYESQSDFTQITSLEATAKAIYGDDTPQYEIGVRPYVVNFSDIEDKGSYLSDTDIAYIAGSLPSPTTGDVISYFFDGELYTSGYTDASGYTPYILAFSNDDVVSTNARDLMPIEIVVESSSVPQYLSLNYPSGNTPVMVDYDDLKTLTSTTESKYCLYHYSNETCSYFYMDEDNWISVYDDGELPTVENIYCPVGNGDTYLTYSTGMRVPIVVEFSEVVYFDADKYAMTVNGTKYTAADLNMYGKGNTLVFWYEVQSADTTSITVSEVANFTDLFGDIVANEIDNNDGAGWDVSGASLDSAKMYNAIEGVDMNTTSRVVTLALNQLEAYRTIYTSYDASSDRAPFDMYIYNEDGTQYGNVIHFTLVEDEEAGTLSATAELPEIAMTLVDQKFTVKILPDDNGINSTAEYNPMSYIGNFTIAAQTPATSLEISADTEVTDLSLADTYRPKLSVTFPEATTYKTGAWSSSNEDIATIDADGQVVLVGTEIGEVYFTYTADNGFDDGSHDVSVISATYTVSAGDSLSLVIPASAANIVIRSGSDANVLWSSNAEYFAKDAEFTYTVEVYEGNYTSVDDLTGQTAVYTKDDISSDLNSITIPASELTALSTNGNPAYTVCVSMPHPLVGDGTDETVRLSALSWIVVNPQAAGVTLTPLNSLYVLDSKSIDIGWTVDNYVSDPQTEGSFTITKTSGSSVSGEEVKTVYSMDSFTSGSGTYSFTPDKVDGNSLKDTYVVTLQARNLTTDAYDVDSYILYVYRDGALQLEINGEQVTNLTMDNTDTVTSYTASAQSSSNSSSTADILALREQLALLEYVGINYSDYSWSQLKDGIAWSTSDDDVTSVNYKQGGLYENINLFSISSYLPETVMALSSVTDGTAIITATHARTGMEDSIEVNVNTLRNEFYLFQITPMLTTTLTYTDGTGVECTVQTNDEGMLALYEPYSIASDVELKATASDGTVYLGTIYQSQLTSGERDSTKLQLYPLNSFEMRQVAQVNLYLTNPDGSPYTGEVTVRGGVYKNDGYCQDALLDLNDTTNLQSGESDQTITLGDDGKLVIHMDSTQFWSEELGETAANADDLAPGDDIQYIFEIRGLNGDAYYPEMVYVNGGLSIDEIMYAADSVRTLREVPENMENLPFISNQTVDYNLGANRLMDVMTFTGHVGPNANYPVANLDTTMLLWGQDLDEIDDFTLQLRDEYGYTPTGQTSSITVYPFSTMGIAYNVTALTEESITTSGWVKSMTDRGVKMRLDHAGTLVIEQTLPFRVLDMTDVEEIQSSSTVSTMMTEMLTGSAVGGASTGDSTNAIMSALFETMLPLMGDIEGSPVRMIISPSEDNTTFNAIIFAGYNGTDLDEVDYSDTGVSMESNYLQQSVSLGVGDALELATGGNKEGGESNSDTTTDGGDSGDSSGGESGDSSSGDSGSDSGSSDSSSSASSSGSSENKWSTEPEFAGQLEGYYEAEIVYNFTTGQWEIYTLGGGFTAGFSGAVTFSTSTFIGPVPVFVEFGLGGAVQIDFKAATRYVEMDGYNWAADIDADTVSDYLTTLRLQAYVNAFGGLGMDMEIASLKFGPYGSLAVDSSNLFLTRPYLANENDQDTDGQYVKVEGEVGAKLEASLAFISYELIFGSGSTSYGYSTSEVDTINDYWEEAASYGTGMGSVDDLMSATATQYALQNHVQVVSSSTTLQDRDYLDEYDRTWGTGTSMVRAINTMALDADEDNALENLQTNANPTAYPYVSDDGYHLLYISDQDSTSIYDTRVYAGTLTSGSYTQGSAIDDPTGFEGYGDSNISLAGTEAFAVAGWVRMNTDIDGKNAGDDLTVAEQNLIVNGAEVVVSVYDDGGWTSTRLTDNATPDLAPSVATNGDGDAIVTWRSVYAADPDNLLDFSAQDYIMYAIYDSSSKKWGDAQQLYTGSAGAVKGSEVAMLPDGTAAVIYTLDRTSTAADTDDDTDSTTDTTSVTSSYEIAYTIINADGSLGTTVFATNDTYLDENPQIVAVDFGDSDDRFVLGWYSQVEGTGDIRLLAIDESGAVSNNFPESLSQLSATNAATIGNKFAFVSTNSNHNSLDDLSIVWEEQVTDADGNTDHSLLMGMQFRHDTDGTISLSAALDVAELPDRNILDHMDAYISGENQIKAVLQATWYDPENNETYTGTDGTEYHVPKEETKLYTATATFENKVYVQNVVPDYASMALNSLNGIQFTIFNGGMDDITEVSIDIGEGSDIKAYDFKDLSIAPSASAILTCWHPMGDTITDEDYTLTATYDNDDTHERTGTVYLDFPDIGISQMKVVEEAEGKRTILMTLYNASPATLAGGKNRTVTLSFYDDSDYGSAWPQNITYNGNDSGVSVTDNVLTISDEAAMALIDNDAFTVQITYDVGDYVDKTLELDEIPDSGVRLFAVAEIVEDGYVLSEVNAVDNQQSVTFYSLLARTNETVTLDVQQANTDDSTIATVSLRNNSLQSQSSEGAMIATLLDASGNVLEQQQLSYDADKLTGEGNATETITFSQVGSSVAVSYGTLVTDSTELSTLSFDGIIVGLNNFVVGADGVYTASVANVNLNQTLVSYVAQDLDATVTINGEAVTSGAGSASVYVPYEQSTIEIVVTKGDTSTTYSLNIDSISNNTVLTDLSCSGVDVELTDFVENSTYTFTANVDNVNVNETLLEYTALSPDAVVTINGAVADGSEYVFIPLGSSTIKIVVTVGEKTSTYLLNIECISDDNNRADRTDGSSSASSAVVEDEVVEEEVVEEESTSALPFMDVPEGTWYYDGVLYCYQNGLLNGTSAITFSPEDVTTRAMLMTVLARMAGEDTTDSNPWYAVAMTWAVEAGVSDGTNPEAALTREQMVTMLYRYAGSPAVVDPTVLDGFLDVHTVSDWALEAMQWAAENGIISGTDTTTLSPQGTATRSQFAVMMQRFLTLPD